MIELPAAGLLPAVLRVLHDLARVLVEARDQRRGIRAGSRREAGLIHRVDLPHVQAQIIDGQLCGLITALLERRLEFLPDGGVLLGRGDRGLLHGRTLHLRGAAEAEAPVVAHAGRHLARRAGGAEESVLDQGVAVGDVGG